MLSYILLSLIALLGFSQYVVGELQFTTPELINNDARTFTGKPLKLVWTGAQGPVTIKLIHDDGSSSDPTISSGLLETTYTWIPPTSLNGQDRKLEISDNVAKFDSPLRSFRPGSEEGTPMSAASSTSAPSSTSSSLTVTTSATQALSSSSLTSSSSPLPTSITSPSQETKAPTISTPISTSKPSAVPSNDGDDPGMSLGVKVGIAVGITATICLISGAIAFAFWYGKRTRQIKYGVHAKSMGSEEGFDMITPIQSRDHNHSGANGYKSELPAVSVVRAPIPIAPVELDTEPLEMKR